MFAKNYKGFTLLEIVVSITILVTVVAGICATFVATNKWAMKNKNRLAALSFAMDATESLRNCVKDAAAPVGTEYAYPAGSGIWGLQAGQHDDPLPADSELVTRFNATRSYAVTDLADGTKQVAVTVNWTQP